MQSHERDSKARGLGSITRVMENQMEKKMESWLEATICGFGFNGTETATLILLQSLHEVLGGVAPTMENHMEKV